MRCSYSLHCARCHSRVAGQGRGGDGNREHHRAYFRQTPCPVPSRARGVQPSEGGIFRQPCIRREKRSPHHNEADNCKHGDERERRETPVTEKSMARRKRSIRLHGRSAPPPLRPSAYGLGWRRLATTDTVTCRSLLERDNQGSVCFIFGGRSQQVVE